MRSRSLLKLTAVVLVLLVAGLAPVPRRRVQVRIGSKNFTESVILGEILRLLSAEEALQAAHYREFGGTRIVFDALVAGEIDAYPEYTGTIVEEILAGQRVPDDATMRHCCANKESACRASLGFSNTYALALSSRTGRGAGRHEDIGSQAVARVAHGADA